MTKLTKLAQLNKIANQCIQDGDFASAAKVHDEFLKIAQMEEPEAVQPEDNSTADALVFAQALSKCPNFVKLLREAPTRAGGANIPTFQPIANFNTIKLVQELLGLRPDGALGSMTINKMVNSLNEGTLDQVLTVGFRKKYKI